MVRRRHIIVVSDAMSTDQRQSSLGVCEVGLMQTASVSSTLLDARNTVLVKKGVKEG